MADAFSILTNRNGELSALSDDAKAYVKQAGDEILARSLHSLFAEEDRPDITSALSATTHQSQTVLLGKRVLIGVDQGLRFDISFEPAGPEKFWVRFTLSSGEALDNSPIAKEDFLTAVTARLQAPGGPEMTLTMVDFEGLRNPDMIAGDDAKEIRNAIEVALRDAAIDGQIGQLDSSSYGVLGDVTQDKEGLVTSVVDAAEKLGVSAENLGAKAEQVTLDAEESDPGLLRGLLSHVSLKFQQTVRTGKAFGANRLGEVAAEIQQAVTLIETALNNGDISISTRDVCILASGDVPLQLAYGALVFGDEVVIADRILVLDDQPELCKRHDRAIVMAALASLPNTASTTPIIVDVGMPTLESGEAARLGAELAASGQSVGFRPHGLDMSARRSKGVQQVHKLLGDGIPVWLVNFSTAIKMTRQLKGAYVEISATFLRDISALPDRNDLLAGLLKVWNDVEVHLVAVNVDSKNLASFVGKLGIAYGVGIAADPAADAPQSSRDPVKA
jgi:hypothetical protein